MNISEATDTELVSELIRRNKLGVAPSKVEYYEIPMECIIADGKDHVILLTVWGDSPVLGGRNDRTEEEKAATVSGRTCRS